MPRHRNPPRAVSSIAVRICVVLALIAGVVLLAERTVDRQGSSAAAAAAPEAGGPHEPSGSLFPSTPAMLTIGDSFAQGAGDPNIQHAYPELVGDAFGWKVTVDGLGGRGFMPTDVSRFGIAEPIPPVGASLDRDAANNRADYIILDCGRNDLGSKDPHEVVAAIGDYTTRLRAAYPKATIVIMMPSYFAPLEAATYPIIAAGIRDAAANIGASVIDPHAEGWYRDVDLDPMLWTDGVHPNAAGHRFLADKLIEDLKRLGIAPSGQQKQGAG